MTKGLLLINLGTPKNATVSAVRAYLAEFLSDRRVIDLPAPLRYSLLYTLILPFRPFKTAKAYQAIWTEQGSPLLAISKSLAEKTQSLLGDSWRVVLGMRYGQPSIEDALEQLKDCDSLIVFPLFPQYASASSGSAIEKTLQILNQKDVFPSLRVIRDYYEHPGFIEAQAHLLKPYISSHEHLLFSFHGLPERHLQKEGCTQICTNRCPSPTSKRESCYRAQCYATAQALANYLELPSDYWSVAFQSRLGKTPWIQPYTDVSLTKLSNAGIKKLLVCCPSFTADCLETLEEIGIQAVEQWHQLQGEMLTLAPCVNDDEQWVKGVEKILRSSPL